MSSGFADGRHAVALEAEQHAVLRQRRNAQPRRLARRVSARCASPPSTAVVNGTGDFDVEVAPLSFEQRVRRQPDSQVQIAGLGAAHALLALAADAHARSVGHPGRNPHVDVLDLPVVVEHEPARRRRDTRPRGPARSRSRCRGRAAVVRGAPRGSRHPAVRPNAFASLPPKNVVKKSENGLESPNRAPPSPPASWCDSRAERHPDPGRAPRRKAVPPLRACCSYIRQFAPSSSYFLRLLGSPRTSYASLISLNLASATLSPGIDVRVELARELAEGLLDLLLAGRLRHAERCVVVLEVHDASCGSSRSGHLLQTE